MASRYHREDSHDEKTEQPKKPEVIKEHFRKYHPAKPHKNDSFRVYKGGK